MSSSPSPGLGPPDKTKGSPGDPSAPLLIMQACGGGVSVWRQGPGLVRT